jgi:hypothetical protein
MKEAQLSEMKEKGFADIGYHFGIGCDGTIFEGRDIRRKGAHVDGANTGLVGVVLLADFTAPGEGSRLGKSESAWGRFKDRHDSDYEKTIPDAQLKALSRVITTMKHYFDIKELGRHREYAALRKGERSCPGDLVLNALITLRAQHGLGVPH